MAGKQDTKSFSICLTQWATWFQLYANWTMEVRLPGKFHQELSLLKCLEHINRCQKSARHSLLQAKVHNKFNIDTWSLGYTGSTTTHRGIKRKFEDSYGRQWIIPTQQIGCNLQQKVQDVPATITRQNSKTSQKTSKPALRVQEETEQYTRCERSNSTDTHIEKKHNYKREKHQTTTNLKLYFPRLRRSKRKGNTLHKPRWRQSTRKEHTDYKSQHKNIDKIIDVSMYENHKKQATPRKLESRKFSLEMLCK